jgi:N-methylhydantoinase A
MEVDVEAARRAIRARIADPLRISVEAAAHGIIQIANANMSRAIRTVSIEKGHDLSTYALCPFGGAGPLHAAEVAVECGIPLVFVPLEPGTLCARGMLLSDLSADYVRSCFAPASADSWQAALEIFAALERDATTWLGQEGIPDGRRQFFPVIDARYNGQNFEIKVDCRGLGPGGFATFVERFHAAHIREYGYAIPERAVDLVNARLRASGIVDKAPQPEIAGGTSLAAAKTGSRNAYVDQRRGWAEAGIFQRSALPVGVDLAGPAFITEMSSTTFVLPEQTVRVDAFGNLILRAMQ